MFDCPPEIIEVLDPDHAERVNEVIRDFLSRPVAAGGRDAPAQWLDTPPSSRTSEYAGAGSARDGMA
jgi:hypothetical protein